MKDEIKEILEYLKALANGKWIMLDLSNEEYKMLYDYIINLQKCYCNRTDCGARIKDSKKYDSLLQEYEKLQEENKKLKEELQQEKKDFKETNDYCFELKDYKQRNEKAIEYIENENICREELPKYARIEINNFDKKYRNELLNILQNGGDK